MNEYSKYVGLDVHKSAVVVAIAAAGRKKPVSYWIIENSPQAIARMVKKLSRGKVKLTFCYEAGPCGYGVYRQIISLGHHCNVVAPSLIPRKAGDRIKTDRRDAMSLARLYRSGELTAVWVPDREQVAMRDLMRARSDMKAMELQARQRLNAFLLRHGRIHSGRRWTKSHQRWLEELRFDQPVQQIVFVEYMDCLEQARMRVRGIEQQIDQALAAVETRTGSGEALMALRGVDLMTAMTVMSELGDITRFDSPPQLMAYLGLVPREHSSGDSQWRGGITKTGNRHVRRLLVEGSWSYRFPARKTAYLQKRAKKTSETVQAIAWKAQKRLCGRYRYFISKGKLRVQACTAVARELVGFIWAIACEVMGKNRPYDLSSTAVDA